MTPDDTPPDGRVWVSATRGRGSTRVYHTRACRYVRSDNATMRTWTRDDAEAWMSECEFCADGSVQRDHVGGRISKLERLLNGEDVEFST